MELLVFLTALVEIVRRSLWAGVRLGNEQFNNTSQYRAVKDIPLLQLDTRCLHANDPEVEQANTGFAGFMEAWRRGSITGSLTGRRGSADRRSPSPVRSQSPPKSGATPGYYSRQSSTASRQTSFL